MQYKLISADTIAMPPKSVLLPKTNRTPAEISATPITANNILKQAPINPLRKSFVDSADASDSPKTATAIVAVNLGNAPTKVPAITQLNVSSTLAGVDLVPAKAPDTKS
ncbi:hypothetical protein NQX30_03210 [Candidatus Persebacteraceae bacterium Df01]|jgi:hypothetical protein|uniref:Secreted protein n=1 Tax=Candidatus Doriopsillibacter californiensis TaxID=2970740 RepID=A0ABT7QKZ2_9GAMM|nr:hypothetical protein [Candidatus Persebacteraceae bacterium Df01]